MNVLVTGATGFIGSHLCEQLLLDGHEVWGISRSAKTINVGELQKQIQIQNQQCFHLLSCDITDYEAVERTFHINAFDAVFHVAACILSQDADDPFPYFETNVRGTVNILRAAQLENVNKVIYSSSMNVYGMPRYLPVDENHPTEPENIYGLTKLMGEMFCRLYAQIYGFKILILRYSGVFGLRKEGGAISNFTDRALKNEPPLIFSDGSDVWDTVYVRDVVTANILALAHLDDLGFDIFNIGIGKGINVTEAANMIIKLTGSTAKPRFGSAASSPTFIYDISKAKSMLGFTPTPFDKALSEFIDQKMLNEENYDPGSKTIF
jgi:UDP-glucose 4-epimerase